MQSRFVQQIKELLEALNNAGVQFALIGGLALASYKVVRATQDIDLLLDTTDADQAHELLTGLGYHCIHRSADAANYLRDDERVDLLYAARPIARRLLSTAVEDQTIFGDLRVLSIEGLVGFKLQALANNPRRTRDLDDIRALMRENQDIDRYGGDPRVLRAVPSRSLARSNSAGDTVSQREQPIIGGEIAEPRPETSGDPYQRFAELMEAVEALCPRWPERETFEGDNFVL